MIYIYGFDPELYNCHSCLMAKQLCLDNNIQFKFISVIKRNDENKIIHDKDIVKELEEKYGDSVSGISLPQIFFNDEYIGGTAMLKEFLKRGINGSS